MESSVKRFKCEHCDGRFDLATLLPSLLGDLNLFLSQKQVNGFFISIVPCPQCAQAMEAALTIEEYPKIRNAVEEAIQRASNASKDDEIYEGPEDEFDDVIETYDFEEGIDAYHHEANESDFEPLQADDKPRQISESGETDRPESKVTATSTMELFKEAIDAIDKNLSYDQMYDQILSALEIAINEPNTRMEACLEMVKDKFKLPERKIEAFRKDVNAKRAKLDKEKEIKQYNHFISTATKKPKELSEEERQAAIAYLQEPNLIDTISKDIAFAGELVGEETNKMMLYLAAVSRKLDQPISLVIFGQSSSGKSLLANTIEKFIPPEDTLTISSSSAKAFEYIGDYLKHKFILIQEWEGMEGIAATIRTLQSEGKLNRLVTIKNPENNKYQAVETKNDCPCCVVVTTTKAGIHDENSTRIFELYTDESVAQTGKVVREILLKANIQYRKCKEEKKRVRELHHNIQRLLEPFEVDIPFAEHLSFPAKTTRNRRDSARFIQLIKTVAFLRQKQKQVKVKDSVRYIEADLDDYAVAYRLGIKVIEATLDPISERARNVLRACCELDEETKNLGKPPWFSVKQIREKAPKLGMDFGSPQELYKHLDQLSESEYLEVNQPQPRGKKRYSVCFAYERDDAGEISNISTPEIKEIATPTQLRKKLELLGII